MEKVNTTLENNKKQRLKINSMDDFKNALKLEGYNINKLDEENFKKEITKKFEVHSNIVEGLDKYIQNTDITYRANDSKDFIDYIEKMILIENEHKKLWKKISHIKNLNIHRIEYEREPRIQEDVDHILKIIDVIKNHISEVISEEDNLKLKVLEREIDKTYLYSKDIELLKKIICSEGNSFEENYNNKTQIKSISIKMPNHISFDYIPAQIGTIEFHDHITKNIPIIQRLTRNIDNYMKAEENATFIINQSKALQGSINIAIADYDNREFKAISGNNDIVDFCTIPASGTEAFKSNKVTRLGKLGIGYDRFNDSEKKIFEEIHKQIEAKLLKNEGELILYSKWEPCPSCYYVISQFCEKHPNIKVQVKYSKKYSH
ncbi:deaminase domain-containing protein [Clostridium sp. C2-6-12]|uniref:deaminase domain-containing protein n=1 Tax=Clostridium sp. C2-6-12 TaxID=2698832 RepID=UPI00136C1FC6|nr:deaminase domain-containing protein [Clostridium sp. C2-6-12]